MTNFVSEETEATPFTLINSDGEAAGSGEFGLLLYNQGTVCDDDFDDNAADAICKEMGYTCAEYWGSGIFMYFTFYTMMNYEPIMYGLLNMFYLFIYLRI